jgi:hypothetical protein
MIIGIVQQQPMRANGCWIGHRHIEDGTIIEEPELLATPKSALLHPWNPGEQIKCRRLARPDLRQVARGFRPAESCGRHGRDL